MEKIAFVGKVVARQDYETRIVLTLLNKSQDKLTVSFFKQDKYTPPEVMEAFNGIAVGAAGTFYYTVSPDGKYKNLKGYDPSPAQEGTAGQTIPLDGPPHKVIPNREPESNRMDGGDTRTRSMAFSYSKDVYIASPIDEDGCRRMTEDQMFDLARKIEKYILEG